MRRGWEVEYLDGTIINEDQMEWIKIPKVDIIRLTLRYDGREWHITGKDTYTQKKRASVIPGVPESFTVESRSIGYYDKVDDKDVKVWYTLIEETGVMKIEIEEL
jgi:hypothetical protein